MSDLRSSFPADWQTIDAKAFAGLQTKAPRPAIKDEEQAWLDNWMPLGGGQGPATQLRTLYGPGPALYTAPAGLSIIYFQSFNITDTPYFFVLLSNGRCNAVNAKTGTATTIGAAGLIVSPSTKLGFAGWGGQYALFSAAQPNGYFIWDGTSLYKSGTIGPTILVTNGGLNYTSAPSVSIIGGSGSGAAAHALIENGSVSQVIVDGPGSGYQPGDSVIALFNGGGNGTATASGTATVTDGVITNATITNGGINYSSLPTVTINDPTGSGASVTVSSWTVTGSSGSTPLFSITGLQVQAGGSGYTAPSLTFSGGGAARQATGFANVDSGVITGLSISNQGLGYTGAVSIQFFAPTGSGATAQAVLDSNGSVSEVTLNPTGFSGKGYSGTVLWVASGNGPAAASVSLMPFGISGTAIEEFQGRAWIANGGAVGNNPPKNRVIFSSPGNPADFNVANGAGAFASTDSFLRTGYHSLRQTNGFLYLIGDSSINYISGVQASTAGGTTNTTFSNQNADPQIGTPWPSSVQVFSRNIVFGNTVGIFVSYGGAVTKVSEPLDGFYASGNIFGATDDFSSAVSTIFGTVVYMLLLPIISPLTGQAETRLLMWDGRKWWTGHQLAAGSSLKYIATQEINSVLQAWGTDGTTLFPLFTVPSNTLTKVYRSRLWDQPSYWFTKTAIRLSGIVFGYTPDEAITLNVDSETGSAAYALSPAAAGLVWSGLSWTGLTWSSGGIGLLGSPIPIGNQGRLLGMTAQTTASDIAILSLSLGSQTYSQDF